ncbi:MAG: fumarylacetoacetase [Burkholderiaceae bacterium]
MTLAINDTHDASLRSWLDSANAADSDFPIQNLPLGRFRPHGDNTQPWRLGVAIGEQIVDLRLAGLVTSHSVDALLAADASARQTLRRDLSEGLRLGSALRARFESALVQQSEVELGLPCDVRDYTDFYTSVHHATTIGKQFRPDNPLLPNYKWVPIGYHGRASSILPSGASFRRPNGQLKAPDADAPRLGPCARLDYELELGMIVGRGNGSGEPVPMAQAEDHVFGLALFNDWSARDIQGWEYQPLGPFLSKNFASTLSPWIITMEALAPYRAPFTRPADDPQPLPYLDSPDNRAHGAIDIELEVWLQTAQMRQHGFVGERLSCSNYKDAYWTLAQLVAHHTVNGCNLTSGDLMGSGTLSGPAPEQGGSLMELSQGGKRPIVFPNGESRSWLQDGDSIILRAYCQRDGFRRIGFGECRGTVLPAPKLG